MNTNRTKNKFLIHPDPVANKKWTCIKTVLSKYRFKHEKWFWLWCDREKHYVTSVSGVVFDRYMSWQTFRHAKMRSTACIVHPLSCTCVHFAIQTLPDPHSCLHLNFRIFRKMLLSNWVSSCQFPQWTLGVNFFGCCVKSLWCIIIF